MKLRTLLERKLRVFDFDDTIASTQSKIHTTFENGKKKSLTPAEYANYFPKRKKGDKFDYSDFKNERDGKLLTISRSTLVGNVYYTIYLYWVTTSTLLRHLLRMLLQLWTYLRAYSSM